MDHQKKVELLGETLRVAETSCSIKHAMSNTLRNTHNHTTRKIDVGAFNKILDFDPESQTITVEPRISFKKLCAYTLKRGFVPLVVPEFASITVGGAIMGGALESSSHLHGQVSDTTLEYELVLGDGTCIRASADENPKLFYGVSGSYGSLALMTAVKLKLMPAKKYVNLTHHHFSDPHEAMDFLSKPHTEVFIEGFVLKPDHAVAITGEMADTPSAPLLRQKWPWSRWFIQEVKQKNTSMVLKEYLFRLDRGAFWMGLYINSFAQMLRLIFRWKRETIRVQKRESPSKIFRFLFGWALSSQKLYRIWHQVPNDIAEQLFFVHDFYADAERAGETLMRFMQQTSIFPIWLCPIKGTQTPQLAAPHFGKERYINIGLYGVPANAAFIPTLTKTLENAIIELGGKKMLYSFTYYPREELTKIYHLEELEGLREQFFAKNSLAPLYNKIKMC